MDMHDLAKLPPRIASKIEPASPSACWLWVGARSRNGYGNVKYGPKWLLPHRLVYELLVGPIPTGLCLDHLCRVRHCVNPAHLEPVTMRENLLRGTGCSARNHAKTCCPRCGAGFTTIMVRVGDEVREGRVCVPCNRAAAREALCAKRAAERAARVPLSPDQLQEVRDARRARRRARARAAYHANQPRRLAQMAAYRDANRETIRAKARAKDAQARAAISAAERG